MDFSLVRPDTGVGRAGGAHRSATAWRSHASWRSA